MFCFIRSIFPDFLFLFLKKFCNWFSHSFFILSTKLIAISSFSPFLAITNYLILPK
jgi:hypothetical protein